MDARRRTASTSPWRRWWAADILTASAPVSQRGFCSRGWEPLTQHGVMKDGPCSRDPHKTSPISNSRRELVAAHLPTAVAAMVISSVRIQGTAKPPSLTGSIAISLGTHRRERISSRVPHTKSKIKPCRRDTMPGVGQQRRARKVILGTAIDRARQAHCSTVWVFSRASTSLPHIEYIWSSSHQ